MKRVFSGIQPSGIIHIGNYLGAIKQWVELQNKVDEAIFCVVDLHAITTAQKPEELKENILNTAALYLACGINPNKARIFIQSSRPEHTELMWILNTVTSVGELGRMTQFKEKSGQVALNKEIEKVIGETNWQENEDPKITLLRYKEAAARIKDKIEERSSAGLLTYPVLMAADILLYKTSEVPVGEDQKQHLELTRNLAQRFNRRYGETFVVPKPVIKESSARIMGLDNPLKKMSKSADSIYNYIALNDNPDTIRRKISRAMTDSGQDITFGSERPAISNLINIYSGFSGKNVSEIENIFSGKSYAQFKERLGDLIIENLEPIRKKYEEIIKDKAGLKKVLKKSSERIAPLAQKTLKEAKEKIGLIIV